MRGSFFIVSNIQVITIFNAHSTYHKIYLYASSMIQWQSLDWIYNFHLLLWIIFVYYPQVQAIVNVGIFLLSLHGGRRIFILWILQNSQRMTKKIFTKNTMSETNTKFSKEQIKAYGEMYNLFPLNCEAMIANMMRLEGYIQDLQADLSLMK